VILSVVSFVQKQDELVQVGRRPLPFGCHHYPHHQDMEDQVLCRHLRSVAFNAKLLFNLLSSMKMSPPPPTFYYPSVAFAKIDYK